ncbi:hypothetical protein WN51_13851 [Melipona quadrifasciata]|uniref:Uncharacterized protein n=1 Tax=Melipona quadrifasciata TaxID=166423 RepID=A0A0M9A164_9HYME|nr:hypothetical protein WN51_13851 [Melipona quadrifasciata]
MSWASHRFTLTLAKLSATMLNCCAIENLIKIAAISSVYFITGLYYGFAAKAEYISKVLRTYFSCDFNLTTANWRLIKHIPESVDRYTSSQIRHSPTMGQHSLLKPDSLGDRILQLFTLKEILVSKVAESNLFTSYFECAVKGEIRLDTDSHISSTELGDTPSNIIQDKPHSGKAAYNEERNVCLAEFLDESLLDINSIVFPSGTEIVNSDSFQENYTRIFNCQLLFTTGEENSKLTSNRLRQDGRTLSSNVQLKREKRDTLRTDMTTLNYQILSDSYPTLKVLLQYFRPFWPQRFIKPPLAQYVTINTTLQSGKGSSEGCCGRTNGKVLGMVRSEKEKAIVLRFVSESLPRLISGADGSDSLPQTLVVTKPTRLVRTHPSGVPHTLLLNVEDRLGEMTFIETFGTDENYRSSRGFWFAWRARMCVGTYVREEAEDSSGGFAGLRAGKCGSRPETECRYAGGNDSITFEYLLQLIYVISDEY